MTGKKSEIPRDKQVSNVRKHKSSKHYVGKYFHFSIDFTCFLNISNPLNLRSLQMFS